MPPVDRDNPVRSEASESSYSLMEFMREFPDDAACLDWLWRNRYADDGSHAFCPKCDRERKFHKVKERPAWDCDSCGHHLHPLAGTIFHKSSTSLHLWFFAIHLMTSTRCGVSAKQLERELGVTYKTAWRMFTLIRNKLMVDDGTPLNGHVEVDETSVDGKPRKPHGYNKYAAPHDPERRSKAMKLRERSRATVFAAVERGGRIKATVLPSRRGPGLNAKVVEWVEPTAIVYTDEWPAYNGLGERFAAHSRINHTSGVYVDGSTHTNTVEGFFGHLKPSIRGTYRKVSHKWLQGYLNEFTFRYNERHSRAPMFRTLLARAANPS
jgi:transposase-like protein